MSLVYKGYNDEGYIIEDTDSGGKVNYDINEVTELVKSGVVITGVTYNEELDIAVFDTIKNKNLTKAKKAKNDEFYTQLADIEKELSNYPIEYFKDKISKFYP